MICGRPLTVTSYGALRCGGLVSSPPRGHLTSWSPRAAPPPRTGVRNRPVSPHPEASPPCGRGAPTGVARLAARSSLGHGSPLHGARWEARSGRDVVRAACPDTPRRAMRRRRSGCRASGPIGTDECVAYLPAAVHPAHVSIPTLRACKRRTLRSDSAHARVFTVTLHRAAVKEPEPGAPESAARVGRRPSRAGSGPVASRWHSSYKSASGGPRSGARRRGHPLRPDSSQEEPR
jgi:hypothetical protein